MSTAVEYETPLGNIEIDHEVNEQLINTVRGHRRWSVVSLGRCYGRAHHSLSLSFFLWIL